MPLLRYTVSLAEVSELHVIQYEVDRDLLPLVLANCQYTMERGREILSEYDLPKIQQQILTRFLQGKPSIALTVSFCSTLLKIKGHSLYLCSKYSI